MPPQKSTRLVKIIKAAASLLMFFILLGSLALTLFRPKDINYYENRPAKQMPAFSPEDYLSCSFQDESELALADQLPLAQGLKKLYNTVNYGLLNALTRMMISVYPEGYYCRGKVMVHGDTIVYTPVPLAPRLEYCEAYIANLNAAIAANPGTEFFVYYVMMDYDLYFSSGENLGQYALLLEGVNIESGNISCFELRSFEDFSEYFHKTEHHWNHKGAYKGYLELLSLLRSDEEPLRPLSEYRFPVPGNGMKATQNGLGHMLESYSVYLFEYPDFGIDFGYVKTEPDESLQSYTYSFYGPDAACAVLDTGSEGTGKILLIGDSFDNALLKLLASHYDETHTVDLRAYTAEYGETFNITEYIEANSIDQVLYMGGASFFDNEQFFVES